MVVVFQQVEVVHEPEDRKMKRNDIKALEQCLKLVGKHIKSSKSKISWSFDVRAVCFTIELLVSSYSGKKRVKLNGQVMKEAKDTSALAFKHSDMAFQLIETSKNRGKYGYDLLINGHAFSELHKARLAQKLLPKFDPTPHAHSSKNVLHIHVESLTPTMESVSPSQTEEHSEGPLSRPRPQVRQQSSRKLLRRSDASVRDIAAMRGRPFRRSEASVKDILGLGDTPTSAGLSKTDNSTTRSSYTASALAARAARP